MFNIILIPDKRFLPFHSSIRLLDSFIYCYQVNWQGLTDIQTAVERVVTDMENLRADVEPFHVVVTDTLLKMQKIKLSVDKLDKK